MNTVEQRAIKQFELRHGVPGKEKKCLTDVQHCHISTYHFVHSLDKGPTRKCDLIFFIYVSGLRHMLVCVSTMYVL